jgi:hypothetical protein
LLDIMHLERCALSGGRFAANSISLTVFDARKSLIFIVLLLIGRLARG